MVYAGIPQSHSVTAINAEGCFNLIIKNNSHTNNNTKVTISQHAAGVHIYQDNHTLFIQVFRIFKKRPVITVSITNLKRLIVNGSVNVTGDQVHSDGLSIISLGSGNIQLRGMMKVDQITQRGANYIALNWVNTTILTIDSKGRGKVFLAGLAQRIYARLRGAAILEAKYLRAKSIQIKTENHSVAYVMPLISLRAFALDKSNIYYYSNPKSLTLNTEELGNILQY